MAKPQWATPERQRHLVELFNKYIGYCLLGHRVCSNLEHYMTRDVKMVWESEFKEEEGLDKSGNRTGVMLTVRETKKVPFYSEKYPQRLYNKVAEAAKDSWKAEDRDRRSFEHYLEQQTLNDGTYGKYGSTFDPVARDAFFATRPEYYLVGMGVSALTHQRVALIRVPSTSVHLFVDCRDTVQELSKNAKRKMKRYGKVPTRYKTIDDNCKAAVRAWYGKHQR
jgi:hypothetical protein